VTEPAETEREAELCECLANCARLLAIAERDAQTRASEADTIRAKAEQHDRLAVALADAREERNAVLASTSWRLTAPLRILIERLQRWRSHASRATQDGQSFKVMLLPGSEGDAIVQEVVPPSVFPEPSLCGPPRVTLLAERFRIGSLTDDTARAAVLAAAMAHRERAPLRIISRLVQPDPRALDLILARHGIDYDGNPSFDWLTSTGRGSVTGVSGVERMVAGSWVDASLALALVSPDRVAYVVDRVEVPTITGAKSNRRVRDIFAIHDLTLVFTDASVGDDLRRAGLFERRDADAPASVLPAAPSWPDWQRIAALLLDRGPRD